MPCRLATSEEDMKETTVITPAASPTTVKARATSRSVRMKANMNATSNRLCKTLVNTRKLPPGQKLKGIQSPIQMENASSHRVVRDLVITVSSLVIKRPISKIGCKISPMRNQDTNSGSRLMYINRYTSRTL